MSSCRDGCTDPLETLLQNSGVDRSTCRSRGSFFRIIPIISFFLSVFSITKTEKMHQVKAIWNLVLAMELLILSEKPILHCTVKSCLKWYPSLPTTMPAMCNSFLFTPDMLTLEQRHPQLFLDFQNGNQTGNHHLWHWPRVMVLQLGFFHNENRSFPCCIEWQWIPKSCKSQLATILQAHVEFQMHSLLREY